MILVIWILSVSDRFEKEVYSVNLFVLFVIFFGTAVNKAWKTLENEEGYKKCQEIVEEAVVRTEEMVGVHCLRCLILNHLLLRVGWFWIQSFFY